VAGRDWVPCFGYGVRSQILVPLGSPTQFVIPLVGTGLGVDPAGNQVGVPDTDPESVTVHRTIGQMNFKLVNQGVFQECRVRLRFTTAMFNADLGALFPFTLDLSDGADANELFFAERSFELDTPGASTISQFADPRWSHFDLTSKRTLRAAEWTCCVVQLEPIQLVGEGQVVELTHWLRSWTTSK